MVNEVYTSSLAFSCFQLSSHLLKLVVPSPLLVDITVDLRNYNTSPLSSSSVWGGVSAHLRAVSPPCPASNNNMLASTACLITALTSIHSLFFIIPECFSIAVYTI